MRHIAVVALAISVALGAQAGAVCGDWTANGTFADIRAATAVFEGVVVRIDQDRSSDCSPDHVVFAVSQVWKGAQRKEYLLLQATQRLHPVVIDGQSGEAGCPMWIEQDTFEVGRRYIVFASGSPSRLTSMGCGLSSDPKPETRKHLEAWAARQRTKSRGGVDR